MNANELKGKITAKGMTIQDFCNQAGFIRSTFDRKMNEGVVMAFDVLVRDMFESLSAEKQAEVVDFIVFLRT